MIGLFIFGCLITAIVSLACGLIITGIRADKRQLDSYAEDSKENVRI